MTRTYRLLVTIEIKAEAPPTLEEIANECRDLWDRSRLIDAPETMHVFVEALAAVEEAAR